MPAVLLCIRQRLHILSQRGFTYRYAIVSQERGQCRERHFVFTRLHQRRLHFVQQVCHGLSSAQFSAFCQGFQLLAHAFEIDRSFDICNVLFVICHASLYHLFALVQRFFPLKPPRLLRGWCHHFFSVFSEFDRRPFPAYTSPRVYRGFSNEHGCSQKLLR